MTIESVRRESARVTVNPSGLRTRATRSPGGRSLLLAIAGIPIFLSVGATGIGPPTGPGVADRGATVSMPLAALIFPIVAILVVGGIKMSRSDARTRLFLAAYVAINILAFAVGSSRHGLDVAEFGFLVQTLIPVSAYVIGRRAGAQEPHGLDRSLVWFFVTPALSLMLVGLTTLLAGGSPWLSLGNYIGPLPIPQIRRYFPTVAAFALVALARWMIGRSRSTGMYWALWGGGVALLGAAHSRTGILVVAAGFGVMLVIDPVLRSSGRVLLGGVGILVVVLVLSLDVGTDSLPTGVARLVGDDAAAQLSTDRRSEAFVSSIAETVRSPIGRAYRAAETKSLGGSEAAIARVSNSENQYGETGLRAGPVAVISIFGFAFLILSDSRRLLMVSTSNNRGALVALWVATTASLCVAPLTQQPLTQPATAFVLLTALGLLRGWSVREVSETPPQAVLGRGPGAR